MKKQILSEEFLRIQKLAGILNESQLNKAYREEVELNELRTLVKQIIKEETMLNEDNLEVKNIAKQLYSFLKKNDVNARLLASVPSQGSNSVNVGASRDDSTSDNGASIYYWDDPKTKQTVIEIHLVGDEQKIQEVEKKLLSTYPGLEQYDRNLMKGGGISTRMKYGGTDKEGTVSNLVFRVKEKTTAKGGLVGNTQQNQKQPAQQQPVNENAKATKKITLNELRTFVKQIIKENINDPKFIDSRNQFRKELTDHMGQLIQMRERMPLFKTDIGAKEYFDKMSAGYIELLKYLDGKIAPKLGAASKISSQPPIIRKSQVPPPPPPPPPVK